jgi:hypothetical protein
VKVRAARECCWPVCRDLRYVDNPKLGWATAWKAIEEAGLLEPIVQVIIDPDSLFTRH